MLRIQFERPDLEIFTHRKHMREELITITRMLLDLPPAVRGDLPAPEPSNGDAQTPGGAAAKADRPA